MPGLLRLIDDPYGITWRLSNRVRRLSLGHAARVAAGFVNPVRFERPVFVIGVPRSGTTMLFRLLGGSRQLGTLGHEGHDLWRTFHHPRWTGWDSDVVGAGEVRAGERRFVAAYLSSFISANRFVEKTPENCLRIPYLLELFPDALFVVVGRNPPDVLSSLINGWRHPRGRYRSYFVPHTLQIPGYPYPRQWCFALIEGWRHHASSPVPEIALAQWEQCARSVALGRALVPPDRWLDLHLEHINAQPRSALASLCRFIGIDDDRALQVALTELVATPANALSAPVNRKWELENGKEIQPLLPRVADAAELVGYRVDPHDGAFELVAPP
ncbi:MAG: sulfotransferase [Actinomycetota bacterium]|nr:sulfotransferase [Actinomycetota bacterium]